VTGVLVTAWLVTSVPPLRSGSLDGHGERAFVEVNILPAEAQDFTLSKAESYRDDPSAGVASVKGDREDLRDLVSGEGLDLFLFDSWWFGDECRVFGEIAAYHGFVQSGSGCPVNLVGGTCCGPGVLHLAVHAL
jgi:hypothetical protein